MQLRGSETSVSDRKSEFSFPHSEARRVLLQVDWQNPLDASRAFYRILVGASEGSVDAADARAALLMLVRDDSYDASSGVVGSAVLHRSVTATAAIDVSAPLARVLRETIVNAVGLLDNVVHCSERRSSTLRNGLANESGRNAEGGAVPTCPICLAAALDDVEMLEALLRHQASDDTHVFLAIRHALWNSALRSVACLHRLCVPCSSSDRGVATTRFVMGSLHALFLSVLDATAGAQRFHVEQRVLCACSSLGRCCALDDDLECLFAFLLINMSLLDTDCSGGSHVTTWIHIAVERGFHALLRWMLDLADVATRRQRQSLNGSARTSALRLDSLNRPNSDGVTPLMLSFLLEDATAARLLLLHGASWYTPAKTSREMVTRVTPLHSIPRQAQSLVESVGPNEFSRLLLPFSEQLSGYGIAVSSDSQWLPKVRGGVNDCTSVLPGIEAVANTLQGTMESILCRSSLSALLESVARKLLAHRAAKQTPPPPSSESGSLQWLSSVDVIVRSLLASLEADDWNVDAVRAMQELLRDVLQLLREQRFVDPAAWQAISTSTGPDRLRNAQSPLAHPSRPAPTAAAAQARSTLASSALALSHLLSEFADDWKVHSEFTAHHPTSVEMGAPPRGLSDEPGDARVRRALNGPQILWEAAGRCTSANSQFHAETSYATHVRIFCPVAVDGGVTSSKATGGGGSQHFIVWIRLSALMGHVTADVMDKLESGHGFVEGCTAPSCPLRGGDLVLFRRRGPMFVAERCIRHGSCSVVSESGAQRVVRRVVVPYWSELDAQRSDPTMWMSSQGKDRPVLVTMARDSECWQRLCRLLRPRHATSFWAVETEALGAELGNVTCRTVFFTECRANPHLPWTIESVLSLVRRSDNSLLTFEMEALPLPATDAF